MDAPEMLRRAAALLRAHGWCQGQYEDPVGRLCMYGAIKRANSAGSTNTLEEARMRVHEVIDGQIISWNDTAGRTEAEVLDVLERAAALDFRPPWLSPPTDR